MTEIKTMLEKLDKRMDRQEAMMEQIIKIVATTNQNQVDMEKRFDHKFTEIDNRFDKIDRKFTEIDNKLIAIDDRFDKVDIKLEKMDERIERVETTVNRIEKNEPENIYALLKKIEQKNKQ